VTEKDIPKHLVNLVASGLISIIFTDNIGPHRKLMPMLQKFWENDSVVLATFDDDKRLPKSALLRMITYFKEYNMSSVVGLRVRRIGICVTNTLLAITNDERTNSSNNKQQTSFPEYYPQALKQELLRLQRSPQPYHTSRYDACEWPRVQNSRAEMLALPTGNGGVLYRPSFFHPVIFDDTLRQLTLYNDDLTFRLATIINGIKVVNGCCEIFGNCQKSIDKSLKKNTKIELWESNRVLNSDMWNAGVAYLKKIKLIKFDKLVQENVVSDRPECFRFESDNSAILSNEDYRTDGNKFNESRHLRQKIDNSDNYYYFPLEKSRDSSENTSEWVQLSRIIHKKYMTSGDDAIRQMKDDALIRIFPSDRSVNKQYHLCGLHECYGSVVMTKKATTTDRKAAALNMWNAYVFSQR